MKRLVCIMVILIIVGGIILTKVSVNAEDTVSRANAVGQVRMVECVVYDNTNKLSVFEDEANMLWSVQDTNLHKGQYYVVWLDDMNTPKDFTDDVILDYCEVDTN